MNHNRTESIRNILTKYSLYKRGLQRFSSGRISEKKFKKWLIKFIRIRKRDLLFLPICENNFGIYYQEIFTKLDRLHRLPTCPTIFTYKDYKKMLASIHKNDILRERYYNFSIFLLLLSNSELRLLNFKLPY